LKTQETRPGQKITNTGFQLAESKGWLNEQIMGKQTPGGQELIDDSSSYNEEISEE